MNTLATSLRQIFPARAFGPPANLAAVESAESAMGCGIPSPLRELYFEFDGFLGPAATPFFYRLGSPDDHPSLVQWNLLFWTGSEFPQEFMCRHLFFGSDGCGGHWAVPLNADAVSIIRWYPDMGGVAEPMSSDFVAFWSAQKAMFQPRTV